MSPKETEKREVYFSTDSRHIPSHSRRSHVKLTPSSRLVHWIRKTWRISKEDGWITRRCQEKRLCRETGTPSSKWNKDEHITIWPSQNFFTIICQYSCLINFILEIFCSKCSDWFWNILSCRCSKVLTPSRNKVVSCTNTLRATTQHLSIHWFCVRYIGIIFKRDTTFWNSKTPVSCKDYFGRYDHDASTL